MTLVFYSGTVTVARTTRESGGEMNDVRVYPYHPDYHAKGTRSRDGLCAHGEQRGAVCGERVTFSVVALRPAGGAYYSVSACDDHVAGAIRRGHHLGRRQRAVA